MWFGKLNQITELKHVSTDIVMCKLNLSVEVERFAFISRIGFPYKTENPHSTIHKNYIPILFNGFGSAYKYTFEKRKN